MATKLVYFDKDKFISMYRENDTPIERFVFRSDKHEYQIVRYDGSNDGMALCHGVIGSELMELGVMNCVLLTAEQGEVLYENVLKDIIENPPNLEDSPMLIEFEISSVT